MQPLEAFVDESYDDQSAPGFYVLAAAVLPANRHAELREAMLAIRARHRTTKLHWYAMEQQEKIDVAKRIGAFEEMHIVTIGAPVSHQKQERGRALCLHRLVMELHGAGVTRLVAEGRQSSLDALDVDTVRRARQHMLPKGAVFRIEHQRGAREPLLWISDMVAGAIRARIQGNPAFFDSLAHCVVEVPVDAT
jgi:hypothetical protein